MGRSDQERPTSRRTFAHMVSTEATATTCRRCQAEILNGYDEGLLARVDAEPIGQVPGDLRREVQALLDGLDTYVLVGRRELVYRSPDRIAAGAPVGTLHRRHVCQDRPRPLDLLAVGEGRLAA